MRFYSRTDRALLTIGRMDQMGAEGRGGGGEGGKGGRGNHIALQTENYGSLHIYFVVQIPPFIDWTCSACRGGVRSHG